MIRQALEAKVILTFQSECWDQGMSDFGWETKVHPGLPLAAKTKSTEQVRSLISTLDETEFANFIHSFFLQFGYNEL